LQVDYAAPVVNELQLEAISSSVRIDRPILNEQISRAVKDGINLVST
jgi:hypothetical protein